MTARRFVRRAGIPAILGLLALAAALPARAAVIDFVDATPSGTVLIGSSVEAGGFRFTAFDTPGGSGGFISADFFGVQELFNANGAEIVMTAIDGGRFDLASFEFKRRPNDASQSRSASDITVIGTRANGGTVSASTGAPGEFLAEVVLPAGFTDLTAVLFRPVQSLVTPTVNDFEFIIDSIDLTRRVQPVPLPASGVLLVLGLAALGLRRLG